MNISCKKTEDTSLKLWYDKPAQKWKDAFPLGNGRLAAMVYGDITTEHYQLNEESLWAGCPENPYADKFFENLKLIQTMVLNGENVKADDFGLRNLTKSPTAFRSYQSLGDLLIHFEGDSIASNYKRELDLSSGISRVSYKTKTTSIVRESFISALDDVLCIRIVSKGKNKLKCTIGIERQKDAKISASKEGLLIMNGQIIDIEAPAAYDDNSGGSGQGGAHMRFAGRLLTKISEGNIQANDNKLIIDGTHEIILLFTAATDYNLSLMNYDRSIDPGEKANAILKNAEKKSWDQLLESHTNEYRTIFNRVSFNLGTSHNDTIPIDRRLNAVREGAEDQELFVYLFQYGRYLLMNSSRRPAVLPANLQGKWNNLYWAPWESDYHLNVNLQMNYWPADVTNLSETIDPLMDWLEKISLKARPIAKEMYNANGWFCCNCANPFGRIVPSGSNADSQFNNGILDPLAGAWMVMNLWDHYEFTHDTTFLHRLFPMLKGASEYVLDVLVTDKNGNLCFVPSSSPENSFVDPINGKLIRVTYNSTYHLSVIQALFAATLQAASILNSKDELYNRINNAERALPQFKIDANGRLQEWVEPYQEDEPGHRHLSHLLGVYPFSLITADNHQLFDAANQSLDWRQKNGQGKDGWSAAHATAIRSRFYDGEGAYLSLLSLLKSSMKNSLNNVSGTFYQIDGNFGATSGISEMLLQSHLKDENGNFIIHLLPALPSKWPSGEIKGLRARGGFIVDITWNNGKLTSAKIFSGKGLPFKVKYENKLSDFHLRSNQTLQLDHNLESN
jgi:alpha-L-fucosidase 2